MAECTVVHFALATWTELVPWLDRIAARVEPLRWNYPEPREPLLFVYAYDHILYEYEEETVDQLQSGLNGLPTSTVCFQLRRLKGDASCEAAIKLTREALQPFDGLAHDTYAEFWTLAEIDRGDVKSYGRFLDCYRSEFNA